ncbi:hypothetical protein VMCG_02874 [Cytospora schulzeri]|uniref:Uncharacterized protein n=1 Tax=Cytospora schulzeri TaxID=448051 RepID=A0A423WZR8_9PEZI|nr:hypothetical protein VMCG_02874 [Valsa malicola]
MLSSQCCKRGGTMTLSREYCREEYTTLLRHALRAVILGVSGIVVTGFLIAYG